jgi:hypothetical protein
MNTYEPTEFTSRKQGHWQGYIGFENMKVQQCNIIL